ncbi:hypothetical protein ATC03_10975 [Agromyces aureus]|uniref:Uncharacterized protein n=1 Tax=Agromyces aureus TaxID=453304 RepID=A0A191WFV4_9MICO|nr:hypothetical protein ATC03_10975 [Agromyces aureus]
MRFRAESEIPLEAHHEGSPSIRIDAVLVPCQAEVLVNVHAYDVQFDREEIGGGRISGPSKRVQGSDSALEVDRALCDAGWCDSVRRGGTQAGRGELIVDVTVAGT